MSFGPSSRQGAPRFNGAGVPRPWRLWLVAVVLLSLGLPARLQAQAEGDEGSPEDPTNAPPAPPFSMILVSPWTPVFEGVAHLVGQTLIVGLSTQVVHALRVDLQTPGLAFLTTPPSPGAAEGWNETLDQTTSSFLTNNGLQVAINANWFYPCCDVIEGLPSAVNGLAISAGRVVSSQEDGTYAAAMVFTMYNQPTMVATNWPPMDTTDVYTAITGKSPLVIQGVNVATNSLLHPRTAMGYTQDKRYLILLTIDGRQAGYSDGATEIETAQWLLALGAYDAINLDGGGSTTMALSDGQGGAMVVNQTIHGGIPGQERPVASHFGIYAPRLKTSIGVVGAPPFPRLNLTPVGPGFPRLAITGVPGQLFRLQYTDSLCYPYWRNLGSGQISPFGGFEYLDPAVPQTRFYRAVLLPNP